MDKAKIKSTQGQVNKIMVLTNYETEKKDGVEDEEDVGEDEEDEEGNK